MRLEDLSDNSGLPEWAAASKESAEGRLQQAAEAAATHAPAFVSTDNLHALTFLSGMFMPLLVPLSTVFAGAVDLSTADDQRAAAWRGEVAKAVPQLRRACAEQVEAAYAQLADAACQAVSEHADAHLESLAEVAEQALSDQRAGESHLAQVRASLDRQEELIAAASQSLDGIGARLGDLVAP